MQESTRGMIKTADFWEGWFCSKCFPDHTKGYWQKLIHLSSLTFGIWLAVALEFIYTSELPGSFLKYMDAWTSPKSIKLEPLGVQSGHWDSILKAPSHLRRTTFSRRSRCNGHYFPRDPQYLKPQLPPGCRLSISHHFPSCYTIENILWNTRWQMWQHLLKLRTISLLCIKHKETFGRVHKR